MALKVSLDFMGDLKQFKTGVVAVEELLDHVRFGQKLLGLCSIDRLIKLLDAFSSQLLERSNPIHNSFPNAGIPYLANWCRKQHLRNMLDVAFQNRMCLDIFTGLPSSPGRDIRAYPKGLAVHWMSANVPVLGFISLLMGILTKNANIIKQSSESDNLLPALLNQLSDLSDESDFNGSDLIKSIAVIRYDHRNMEIGAFLSSQADIRIIWGNDESVKNIQILPAKSNTNDIVFPNRTSFIVIGEDSLIEDKIHGLTKRIAKDVSVFEQKACASPHTVFLMTNDDSKLRDFAVKLKNAMQSALRQFPKIPPSRKEALAILNLRAQYDMRYEAWFSEGTEFTILYDDLIQLGPPIGNRTIYIRKLLDIEKLSEIITPNVQTVGLSVDVNDFEFITSILAENGVHRITPIGNMTHFDLPWDGYLFPQHLVRWTSRPILIK